MSKPELITLVADLLETRDMCGNEADTLAQWQADNGRLTPAEKAEALRMFESDWRESQRLAGVRPLSCDERAKAHRDINSGGR